MKGTREMRAVLIRDPEQADRGVGAEQPEGDRAGGRERSRGWQNVSEDVLRIIGTNRAWMKNYGVVLALTKNPKTPLAMSMNLMARLTERICRSWRSIGTCRRRCGSRRARRSSASTSGKG